MKIFNRCNCFTIVCQHNPANTLAGKKIFYKNKERMMREGLLRHSPSNILNVRSMMWSFYDSNGYWCSSSVREPYYLGREVRVVRDSENPFSHYWTKIFHPNKINVGLWTLKNHPEWFEVMNEKNR